MRNSRKWVTFGILSLILFTVSVFSYKRSNQRTKNLPEIEPGQIHQSDRGDSNNLNDRSFHDFDGQKAYQHILDQIDFGYRLPGSLASENTAIYIKEHLESYGWIIEFQEFFYNGVLIRNVIAFNRKTNPDVLFGAHYDTRSISDQEVDSENYHTPVTGANDGASGTAVLLEMGRNLYNSDKNIWLVFFDAEDQGNIGGWNWSVGAQYFVDNIEFRPDNVIIIDMVGDKDQNIYIEKNSDKRLCDQIWNAAQKIGLGEYFFNQEKYSLTDDHIPFIENGIPACLLIDFDYPYWHTLHDTPDKVSADSLQKVGDTLMQWLLDH